MEDEQRKRKKKQKRKREEKNGATFAPGHLPHLLQSTVPTRPTRSTRPVHGSNEWMYPMHRHRTEGAAQFIYCSQTLGKQDKIKTKTKSIRERITRGARERRRGGGGARKRQPVPSSP